MNRRSIRFRLAVWYSAVLALALICFGGASWIAIRHALFHTVDETLKDRVDGLRHFMTEQIGALSVEEIRDEFKEHSVLGPGGDLFQVCDARGVWLYRSAPLESGGVPIPLPQSLPHEGVTEDRTVGGAELRFLARRVDVLGKPYTVQVAVPMHELREGLSGYAWALVIMIPAVLLIATAGGWWMSRRALQPVDHIIDAARSIGEQSLAHRLPVPETQDELQRLSETLNQMLARIEGAFRRVTEFTADASHELRTPVALMRTTAEVALRKQRTNEEYRQALEDVHAESVRTTELIENLLTLARADAGKSALERREIDLAPIVREASQQGQKLAHAKSLAFRADIPETAVHTLGDATALRRLLLIVIDNAVKYTPAGEITVRLSAANGRPEVRVSDTGVGISELDLSRVFERFYRADKSRNRPRAPGEFGRVSADQPSMERESGDVLAGKLPGPLAEQPRSGRNHARRGRVAKPLSRGRVHLQPSGDHQYQVPFAVSNFAWPILVAGQEQPDRVEDRCHGRVHRRRRPGRSAQHRVSHFYHLAADADHRTPHAEVRFQCAGLEPSGTSRRNQSDRHSVLRFVG
jgi:signal transduction histidine kinase